ncbi:MAG TPA: hypothetical protein VIY86_06915 [Pirellulaceae bacterium]
MKITREMKEATMTLHDALSQTVNGRKVSTTYWAKPIPIRQFDWEATFADYDLGDPIGFGRTEEEALADLMEYIDT